MIPSRCWATLWCALVLLSSCKESRDEGAEVRVRNKDWPGHFVSARWVAGHQGGLRLIDVRSSAEYASGHLAGAVNLPLGLWHEDLVGRTDRMVPAARLERFLSDAGVAPENRVVCYGSGGELGAVRAAWVLSAYGHERVAVMLDGIKGWGEAGGALTSEEPEWTATVYQVRLCGDRVANELSVLSGISDPGVTLLDVRRSGANGNVRRGRIPNSLGLDLEGPVTELASHAGVRELQAVLKRFGREDQRYVVYSDNGMRASLVGLAMRDLGTHSAVYDGGWNEWASHPRLPIEWVEAPEKDEAGPESTL